MTHPAIATPAPLRQTVPVIAFARLWRRSVVLIVLLAVWEIAPRQGWVNAAFFPPFSLVARAWWDMLLDGTTRENLVASLVRSSAGFGLAVLVAVPLGLFIGWYRVVSDYLNPVIELFRNTATLALLPVFILLLGIGEVSKIAIVFYACTWAILLNTVSGVHNVDPLLIKAARSMGLGPLRLFQKVVLPSAVPTIFTGIRLAGATSILVLVAAEMVGANAGLGYYITYAQNNFQIDRMYAGILTVSALGLFINYALVRLERHFSAWKH
jgi:NitT/TauT family transport system permease protein